MAALASGPGGASEEQARKCSLITLPVSALHVSDISFAFYLAVVNKIATKHVRNISCAFLFAKETLMSCAKRFFSDTAAYSSVPFLKNIWGIQRSIQRFFLHHVVPGLKTYMQVLNKTKMAKEYATGMINTWSVFTQAVDSCDVLMMTSFAQ